MGYEIHISRAEEYYDSEAHPIPLSEWLSYAESNPALSVGGWAEARMPIYAYTCTDGSEVSLSWSEGAIRIKGRFTGDPYQEFGTFAVGLKANLQGDEGERYTANGVLPG